MRSLLISLLIYILVYPITATGDAIKIQRLAVIPGQLFKVIESAEPALREQHLKVENYSISVLESASSYFVTFKDPKNSGTGFGSAPGELIGFEVELEKNGLRILRSNYIR